MVHLIVADIPVVRIFLKCIGRHSANIYLLHAFIYHYFYSDLLYSFHESWLIFTVLLGITLTASVLIELMKKVSGYNRLVGKLLTALNDQAFLI